MAIAPVGTPALSNSGGSAATTATATLASTNPGDYNVIIVSANTSGATSPDPATTCVASSGGAWANITGQWKTGSPSHRLSAFGKFYVAGDTAPVVTIAATGNIIAGSVAYSGVDPSTPVVSGEAAAQAASASSTSWATPSITTAAARWLIAAFGDRTSGTTWSNLTDTLRLTGIIASAANVAIEDTNANIAAGTYSRTATSSAATSVGNTLIFALNPAASGTTYSGSGSMTSASTLAGSVPPPGAGAGMVSGSTFAGVTTATEAAAAGMVSASSLTGASQAPIVQAFTSGTAWIAHRGGYGATLGEETLECYTAAAAQYSKAILELSIWDTSDGVYVCCHNSTLTAVFGDSRTITSTTWAALSPNGVSTIGRPASINGGNPLRRLEEILDAFPTRLFLVENKHGVNQGTLSTLLDAHAPGRWAFKGPYNDTANANIAATHGAPMWLYFYNNQLTSLSTTLTAVSGSGVPVVYGLGDFSAAPIPVQADSNTFYAFTTSNGLRTFEHIFDTTAQKSNADTQATAAGATLNGYMVNSFAALAPSDSSLAAGMTSGSLLGGAAARGQSATAGMTSTSVLTAATIESVVEAAVMTSASTLAGAVSEVVSLAAGMVSASTLTTSATTQQASTATMTSTSTLTDGPTSLVEQAAAVMVSASTLTGNAIPAGSSSALMASGSTLSGGFTRQQSAVGPMTSTSVLTSAATSSGGTTAAMVSGSLLLGAVTAQQLVAAAMTSASHFLASATVPAGTVRDIILTGYIEPDRWAGLIEPNRWAATIEPNRWTAELERQ